MTYQEIRIHSDGKKEIWKTGFYFLTPVPQPIKEDKVQALLELWKSIKMKLKVKFIT